MSSLSIDGGLPMIPILALLAPSAHAFAPTDEVWTGIEPHRVQTARPQVQARFLRSADWQRFATTDGQGWDARFDEVTGTPRWMWGRGIPMPTGSEAALTAAIQQLLERHRDLLGLEGAELVVRSANYVKSNDTWYVDFDALRGGLPTWRGGISTRVKHGNLVLMHVATAPRAPVTGALALDPARAITIARTEGPAPAAVHTEESAEPILLEVHEQSGLELRRAWLVRSRTADPPGIWVSFVDGATGEILSVHNEVRFVTGTVSAMHHERTLDGSPLVTSPVPLAPVSTDTDAAMTDANGVYDITAGPTYTTVLDDGDYVRVYNAAGGEGTLVESDPNLLWTTAAASQAEISSYVFLHQVQEWGQRVAPDVPMVAQRLDSNVNLSQVCNAYWDGDVNFFQSGGGCNNTGQIADVNYHEWGHGFHYYSIQSGYFDGSLSEGASDTVAFFLTGDRYIAPFFGTSGWAIRDVAPDQVYPQDYSSSPYAVHSNGLIFGGAMWDLWDLLKAEYGDEAGTELSEQIFTGLLKGGTDIPGTYYEALLADDDDGNIDNGTPNVCHIIDAFGRHGLGTFEGGGAFVPGHEPLVTEPADIPIEVDIGVLSSAPDCVSVSAAAATLHWRKNGRQWKEEPVTVTGSEISGVIPAQPLGTFVEYYVTGTDTDGIGFAAPLTADVAPYSFYVGDVLGIHCDDFEADDGGYEHRLVSGDEQDGADDWQWGSPTGASGDPAAAFSGNKVWGNDLGHDNFNGAYQPDKVNRLKSPKIDTAHYTDVFLQYRRWLNVEDGAFDRAVITANQQEVWSNLDSGGDRHHTDRDWISHSVDLMGIADQGDVRIGFEIHSDSGFEMGGWTIDDVCVYAPATPDNRLGITDFVTEDQGGPIGLSWTNPIHEPVVEVRVVRNRDRLPEGVTDGDVVVTIDDPVAGEAVETVHTNLDGTAGYYAVYASDGTDWLSWTIEGWNASFQEANEGVPGAGALGVDLDSQGTPSLSGASGCACDSAAPAAGWLGLGLAGLVLRRRRC